MADLVPVIEQIKVLFADTKLKLADNGGWDVGDFRDVYEAFIGIAVAIEAASSELGGLTEAEKKQVLANTLNWMIDLPWVPDPLEGVVFDLLVNIIWEAAKDRFGPEPPVPPVA
jgi:hypothetical protein